MLWSFPKNQAAPAGIARAEELFRNYLKDYGPAWGSGKPNSQFCKLFLAIICTWDYITCAGISLLPLK